MDNQRRWQIENELAIANRLDWLRDEPDGTIYFEPVGIHFITVIKAHKQLRLVLVEQNRPVTNVTQSRLKLDDPLHLVARYGQAVVLSLVWQPNPVRICVLGFGGGRIPQFFHHHLPQTVVDCADIEPALVAVAQKFFGVALDERLRLTIADGRVYLAQQSDQPRYNIILVDVYLGNGYSPYKLATQEFYQLCRSRLTDDGVLVVNLLTNGPFYAEKINTLCAVFEQVYVCSIEGNSVAFATAGPPLTLETVLQRAHALQREHYLSFSLGEIARRLKVITPDPTSPTLLTDANPPANYFDDLPSFNPTFSQVAPDAPCPCGSGEKFEVCHGKNSTMSNL